MRKIFAYVAVLFAVTVFAEAAFAQDYTCVIINGQKCYIYKRADGTLDTVCDGGSTGSGTFTSTNGPISPQGAVNTNLIPKAVSARIVDPTLGTVTTSLDLTRPASATTITSNAPGVRFPLTVRIKFPATATASAKPGVTYVSRTELEFGGTNVNSVDPFVNETLTLRSDVEFYDRADPQKKTVFKLEGGTTNVTLGSDNLD